MKNYVQPGNTITLIAPYAVASGDGLLVGSIFGIAAGAAALGEPVETALVGVFDITKVGSQAWTVGAKVYWDDTNKRTTNVATSNTLIGVAVEALWRGRYSSYRGGLRLMRRLGWPTLAAMGDALLGAPLATPLLAQRGDIVLSADGRGFGVCLGAHAVGMAPAGLISLPLSTCTRAWRV